MRLSIQLITIVLGLSLFQACADYKIHYSKNSREWEANRPDPESKIEHTVFLIGDAGYTPEGKTAPALVLMGEKLHTAGKNSTVVYLGDNIYPNGMGAQGDADREQDEARLRAQLDILEGYSGKIFFIAGNHDWYGYGLDGLKREKKFIEKYLGREDVLFPKPGCGDPVEVGLSDHLTLVLIDSQWYLEDWDEQYEVNDGCEVKSREVFREYVEEAIKSNRNKNVIVAIHHPPYTYGPHGGQFTVKQHLFPLTDVNKNLWIPLPVLGSLIQFLRGTVGHPQDASHPEYRELANIVINAARKNGNFVIASGHEHNLQYIEQDGQYFVVSGAGSKKSPSRLGKGAMFTYGHSGFAQLDYYQDGSAWIQYWVPEGDGTSGTVAYRKQVKGPLKDIVESLSEDFSELPDSIDVPVSQGDFTHGPFWNFLWGKHYRKTYGAIVRAPVLKLDQFKGGLSPVKRGGGYQTNSLRLEAENGKQYVIRSIDKDASRTLGYPFNKSIVADLLKDNFSASHPLSALPVTPLAKAAGIYYTQPQLCFLPPQPALGIYNDEFANALYILEERPDDNAWKDAPQFGYSKNIISTSDVVEKIRKEHDEMIDYRWVARSRLFDALLGDWDRHDDQWRWAETEEEGRKYFRPIPRDRDQAFCKYDGLVLSLARGASPDIKKLMVFGSDPDRIRWLVYNARHFDRTFLSGADWPVWEAEVHRLQTAITDELIDSAFLAAWPPSVYALDGPTVTQILKERRNNLMEIARHYYDFIAREVDVVGTDKKDLFLVERLEDGDTRVRVYDTNKKGKREELLFERTFHWGETHQIFLYGLDDDDIFKIKGEAGRAIRIRAVGGLGEDTFKDESRIAHGGSRRIRYYDAPTEDNKLEPGPESTVLLKKAPKFNIYNRRSIDNEFNYLMLLPLVGANPDDGLLLGLSGEYRAYGFRKSPYASLHRFSGKYALKTGGLAINYYNEFIDLFGKWGLSTDARLQTPLYAINFYGFGNDTPNPELEEEKEDLNYNRVRQRLVYFSPAIMRRFNTQSRFAIGPTFESIRVDTSAGRYITDIAGQFDPELFDGLEFVGAHLLLDYRNMDNPALPSRGIGLFLDLGWKQQLDNTDKDFGFLDASFSAYQNLDRNRDLVFATRIGVQHRFGDGFEFYQGARLGGPGPDANFRGFRRNRFTGNTAFFQNIDLRWKMLSSENRTLPFSFGLTAGFDHGRVWLKGEESDTWHYSYGGGIWFTPFDLFVIQASVFRGDNKQNLIHVGGSYFF